MPAEDIDVFVICRAGTIEQGGATAFSLSRIDEVGAIKPFPIVIIRTGPGDYLGYVNICPHEGSALDAVDGEFFTQDRKSLKCGQHGAKFDIATGLCNDGPCKAKSLEPIALVVIDGEVCLCGVKLVEDDTIPDPFADADDGIEILIQPD